MSDFTEHLDRLKLPLPPRCDVVPIRPMLIPGDWSVECGPDTLFEDVRRACRVLNLRPVWDEDLNCILVCAEFGQTPPTAEEVAHSLFGLA